MFKGLKRIVYPVQDLQKAKTWYSDILGYPPIFDGHKAAIFPVGSCSLSLTESALTSTAESNGMAVYWEVDDIEAVMEALLQKGAVLHTTIAAVLNIRTAKVIDPFGNIIGITDQGTADNRETVEAKPSETALSVAFCRALAAKEERQKLKGPDYIAEIFLSTEAKELLSKSDTRTWAIQNLVTSPLYGYFLARTAYIDDIFLDACREGIPQIVFLGAGYDTRSIRFSDYIKNTKIYELDISTTQMRKVECLGKAGFTVPQTLSYVQINFEKDNILDTLLKVGYNPKVRSLFIWEGVMYYLTRSSIESTLKFISEQSGPKSRLCFDCMSEELQSVNAGEPFRFWMKPDELMALLLNFGLNRAEFMDSNEMKKRYLTMADGVQTEKCLTSFFFMLAEKN
ncbi:MAG: SAM-dependent methyltransferase [Clostridiaceae bacterium]